MNIIDILTERGYTKQFTHETEIRELFEKDKIVIYAGFDPTSNSLHVGHLLILMLLKHLQLAGNKCIALLGGSTAMIGDPTGKSDMRKMLNKEEIDSNIQSIKIQMEHFINFSDNEAILLNNSDWLLNLNYVDFIRDIGVHFSVNHMLSAECFKNRLENGGLSFLEFNYMLMQSYDFYYLHKNYDCVLQVGGDDQWSNQIFGVELIKKMSKKSAYAMTCPLLTTKDGKKMGKTEASGTLWLSKEKTTVFDFYQYWRNIDDADVEKCLKLLTFLPIEDINKLCAIKGKEIIEAKKILAYEITKIVHGEADANEAKLRAESVFEKADYSNIPEIALTIENLEKTILDVLVFAKIVPSKNEGRRLVDQGGLYVNDNKISDQNFKLTEDMFSDGYVIVKKGKKNVYKFVKHIK